jgi:Peptidase A4 family
VDFLLDCTGPNGQHQARTIQLRAETQPTSDKRPAAPIVPPAGSQVRPPLDREPSSVSEEELLRLGYPARPDPATNPDAYATWLRAVTKPATRVAPRLVPEPDVKHGPVTQYFPNQPGVAPGTSTNWSGFGLTTTAPVSFRFVAGQWTIPRILPACVGEAKNTMWVGIDGFTPLPPNPDIVQSGITQHSLFIPGPPLRFFFYFSFPWIEYFPDLP